MKNDGIFRDIRTQDAEHVALLKTSHRQASGNAMDQPGQVRIGNDASGWSFDKRWFRPTRLRFLQDKGRQRNFRYGDFWKGSPKDHVFGPLKSVNVDPV